MDDWIRMHFPLARAERPNDSYVSLVHPVTMGLSATLAAPPGGALLFDLETLGFVGRPIFLVGLMTVRPPAAMEVVQLLARDYTEEEAILLAFAETAAEVGTWVSFNGKSFDLPSLRRRAAYYGLKLPEPPEHLDLLYPTRRLYRGVLPNCKLKTLESRVFGEHRVHDLSGEEIPPAYHAFVRTGDPGYLMRILKHNREDLLTLLRLWIHIGEPF